ncbi:MAG: GGDEF domain-containing protein [Tabrizicola sp.]
MPGPVCALPVEGLSRFMPMHLLLEGEGTILSVGPTLARVLDGIPPAGARFEDLFEVRSPGGAVTVAEVLDRAGQRFRLMPRNRSKIGLRGVGMRLDEGRQILLNLSFGIDLIAAVRKFSLSDADFAATDLAMELLYLAEANAAVTRELRALNLRLEGARMAAEEEALTDPLTGLRNRRAADLLLERLCAAKAGFGLLHIDLDYFKKVNDSFGHAAGDHVLETVSRILAAQIRAGDCAARIGGDEFLVIILNRTEERVLRTIAERIIARVSDPIDVRGSEVRISASVGIARSVDLTPCEPARILAEADRALYAAKRSGRGRAVLLPPQGN